MTALIAGVAGVVFGIGLLLSGMTDPNRVIAFLDVSDWDPTLAFVMGGAIAVHAPLSRWILRRTAPLRASRFAVPTRQDLDRPLVVGAVLFGVGWGLSGYCPGPSLVAAGAGSSSALIFVAASVVGLAAARWLEPRM